MENSGQEPYKLGHLKSEKPVGEHGYCTKCRWWCTNDADNKESVNPRIGRLPNSTVGECRFGQPQLSPPSADGKIRSAGLWPVTFSNDWCRDYEPHKGAGGLAGRMTM